MGRARKGSHPIKNLSALFPQANTVYKYVLYVNFVLHIHKTAHLHSIPISKFFFVAVILTPQQ